MRARRHEHDERGAVALFTALTVVMLCIVAALAVDIGNTWARRGQLQVQADRAAAYAAQSLPARNDAARLKVAKAVAFYLACHPVKGQGELNPDLPACPDGPESATLTTYATKLLDTEMVTFPAGNEVHVVTPKARIGFTFGEFVDASGTEQRKQATAKVTSPGMLSPMALSLDCLLNFGANLTGGLGLPFGYISTTHKGGGPTAVTTSWGTLQDAPKSIGLNPDSAPWRLLGGAGPVVRVTAMNWPELTAGQSYVVYFARGQGLFRNEATATGSLTLTNPKPNRRTGYMDVVVPAAVMSAIGQWQVKVAVRTGSQVKYSGDTATFDVTADLLDVPDVSCGRLLKSPREGTNANANFALNLKHGIDHLVEQYPTLVGNGGLTRDDLLEIAQLTQCASSDPRTVKDTNGGNGTPNCVITKMSNAYEAGFTDGMIGPDGRLTCTTEHPCRPGKSFSLNGRQVNNDLFTDFVKDRTLLSSSTFFNLDSYLTTGIPVVTPTSNLDRSIYASHRFMWVAVLSTVGATSSVQAGDYPVLTFRPIFVTQQTALEELPLLGSLANSVVKTLDSLLLPLLAGGVTDQNGLMIDPSGKLSAIRFLTISPDALPAVPADYTGPESEYLGVGPRIIRLVQ